MTKKHFSLLLIILMLISPIASAFDHCSGMAMRGHFSASQSLLVAGVDDNASTSKKLDAGQRHDQNQAEKHCHSSANCTFHVCSGCGIAASALFSGFIPSYSYSSFSTLLRYSTFFAPEIRPPIQIL
jgi:hypothetical protein